MNYTIKQIRLHSVSRRAYLTDCKEVKHDIEN